MKLSIKRWIAQLFFLIAANLGGLGIKSGLCYPFFYCHACPTASAACPLRSFEISVYKGSFAWKLFLYPLLIISVVGTLSGRAVCGWACPIGLLQRATSFVPKKLIERYSVLAKISQHKIEKMLRYVKYLVLIGLVFVTTYLIGFMFTDICPVGFLTGTIPILILNPGKFTPNAFFNIALIIFFLFLILIFIIERGWCRYFCPIGALLAPFNKISLIHIKVDISACTLCHLCSKVCPMGIDVPNMHRDPECILCGKCVKACPSSLITFERT